MGSTTQLLPCGPKCVPPAKRAPMRSVERPAQIALLSDEQGWYVRIPLTRGKQTLIDYDDLALVNSAGTWHVMWNGAHWYVKSHQLGYLHRFLMGAPANTSKRRCEGGTSSRFKGVDLLQGRYWRAQIVQDRQRHHLGVFGSEEEAAHAYNTAALERFGPFARLNVPDAIQAEAPAGGSR